MSNSHLARHSELEAEVERLTQLMCTEMKRIPLSEPIDLAIHMPTSLVPNRDEEVKMTTDDVKSMIKPLEN